MALTVAIGLLALGNVATAGVIPVATGYEVSYGISMNPGSSNGNDVKNVFIFEWNDASDFRVGYAFTIAGQGHTYLKHTIDFAPTSALLIGYGLGISGIGDGKDHLFTATSSAFAQAVTGIKWSEAFPGVPPEPRVTHAEMIDLLADAAVGDRVALSELTAWVKSEGFSAAFNPAGAFTVVEWTGGNPIGSSIPEPGSLALIGLGLAGLGFSRRRTH
jgi:hypothetical protein